MALRSLAALYVAREKFNEADPLYKLALAIFDKDTPQKKQSKKLKRCWEFMPVLRKTGWPSQFFAGRNRLMSVLLAQLIHIVSRR